MKTFIEILNEAKKDADLSNIPTLYKKQLAPFESDISTAHIDDKTSQTIIYISSKNKLDDIKKAIDKENIVSITNTSDDIKLILK